MAEIVVAKSAGFCFGVRRATDAVEKLINENPNGTIVTVGSLIHNRVYTESLKSRGVIIIEPDEESGLDKLYELYKSSDESHEVTAVIRTHGIRREISERLAEYEKSNPYFHVLDCTCPFVKKIHKIAAENSGDGKLFILIGDEFHPEVQGIISYIDGDYKVFENSDQLFNFFKIINEPDISKKQELNSKKQVSMAAQTTFRLSEWKKCQENIKKVYTNALIFDTICSVTEERQCEAERLSQISDMMFVIGGRNSSNTKKLFDICAARCDKTYLIETAAEIPPRFALIQSANNIGITAGASTPDSIIQEVKNTMNEQTMAENFETLLEESMKNTLKSGDTVKGVVTSISQNEIHLDIGDKATGIITLDQITDDSSAKLDQMFKIGDEIEAFVIKVSDIDGIATLSKKRIDSTKNWRRIVDAAASGETLEGKIIEVVKGGVIISLDSVRVFIPASMTGVPKDGDLSSLLNTVQKVKIVEIKEDRHRAYASIRAYLKEQREAKEAAFWSTIEEGKEYTGEVKSLTSYGAFVDLGGVDGMVHTSELSWRRIKHPSEVVNVGDVIKVYVKSFDPETKRISLGYKTEDMDPWNIFTSKYSEGDTASVKIVSLMPFGAFAELVPGADGLIHISQISTEKINNPADVLQLGQVVDAKIIAIDYENRKISLSIRALLEEAAQAENEAPAADENGIVYSTDKAE